MNFGLNSLRSPNSGRNWLEQRQFYRQSVGSSLYRQIPVRVARDGPSDFDRMELNDKYYKEVGLTSEEAKEQLELLWEANPKFEKWNDTNIRLAKTPAYTRKVVSTGEDQDLDNIFEDDDIDEDDMDMNDGDMEEDDLSEEEEDFKPFGRPAILLAGFRDHEMGMVRATMDSIGEQNTRVIPCAVSMLHQKVAEAIELDEPDWGKPREGVSRSLAWGSHRTILFAGLTREEMLTIIEVLEGGGLPQLVVAIATKAVQHRVLGELLAESVKTQRQWKPKDDLSPHLEKVAPGTTPPQLSRSAWRRQPASDPEVATMAKSRSFFNSGASSPPNKPPAFPKAVRSNARLDRPTPKLESSTAPANGPSINSIPNKGDRQNVRHKPEDSPVKPSTTHPKASSSRSSGSLKPWKLREKLASRQKDILDKAQPPLSRDGSHTAVETEAGLRNDSGNSSLEARSMDQSQNDEVVSRRPSRQAAASMSSERQQTHGISSITGLQEGSVMAANFNPGYQEGNSKAEHEEADAGTGLSSFADIESSEFANEQRALRAEAAAEMRRRADAAKYKGPGHMQAENLIDAVASGEDLSAILNADAPPKDPQALQEARYREARKKMEVLLEEMRRGVSTVPEDKQQKYKADLKALESEKEAVSKVVSDLEAGLDTVPKDDRVAVKAKLREEAWQPTKDAIGAALACGISADEIRNFIKEAEMSKAEGREGWFPSVTIPKESDFASGQNLGKP